MERRMHKLIDRKFQLSMIFSIIRIVFLIIGVVIVIIGINFTFNNKKFSAIMDNQREIIVTEDNIFKTLLLTQKKAELKKKFNLEKVTMDHENSITMMNNHISTIEKIISYNNLVLVIIITFFLILVFLLYFLLIRKTHKISGPIDVMSEYIQDIIEGEYPNMRPIRKDDEFKEFYYLFSKMVNTLKERYEEKK